MTDNTFNVGDRVVLPAASNLETWNVEEDDTTRGEVVGLIAGDKFSVKWDSSWRKPNPSTHNASDLIPEAEADSILSKLEQEYEAWAAPIRVKLEEAGKLLREAGQLADAQGQDLAELHDIVHPLMSAMGSVGWRTSSLRC